MYLTSSPILAKYISHQSHQQLHPNYFTSKISYFHNRKPSVLIRFSNLYWYFVINIIYRLPGMNRTTFPETPAGNHCPEMTVLERQRASHKWQLQQQQENSGGTFCMTSQGPDTYNGWPDLGVFGGYEVDYGIIPKMPGHKPPVPLPPVVGGILGMSMQVSEEEKVKESVLVDGKGGGQAGDESLGKRKYDKSNITKTEDDHGMKVYTENAESKLTAQSDNDCKNNKETNSKENAKNSHVQKQDYIHVRARRGQATDSHSLAERVRREKISERMKFLQDLVPGCNKITGKAGMLDEIINYVQSLQRQVEFLTMKLAVVNPRLDIDIDRLFAKEITPACTPNFPSIEMPPDLPTQGFLHSNPMNQLASRAGLALGVNPNQGIWRTISAPLPATEKFLEPSNFPQMQAPSAIWEDISLENLYNVEFQQVRTMPCPSHQYTGSLEIGNMKIEM